MHARRLSTVGLTVATAVALAPPAVGVNAGVARGSFRETDLVSNIPGRAQHFDADLVNPWGISAAPVSPTWVADNNAGATTLSDGAGNGFPPPANGGPLVVTIPLPDGSDGGAPTGTVFNPTSDFEITKGGTTGKVLFIFATEDGTIAAWKQDADITHAVLPVDTRRPRTAPAISGPSTRDWRLDPSGQRITCTRRTSGLGLWTCSTVNSTRR